MPRTSNYAKMFRSTNDLTRKDANLKRHKLLNQKHNTSNVLLSETNITCTHCACARATTMTHLIANVSQCMLSVECGGCDAQKNRSGTHAMVYNESI